MKFEKIYEWRFGITIRDNEIHKSQKTWTIKLINYDKFDVPDENLLIRECAKRCEVIRLRWYD